MCFSAGASFLAGAFLLGVGISSLRQSPRRYIALAVVPLFFAVQQIAEGILWIILEGEKTAASSVPIKFPFFVLSLPVAVFKKEVSGMPFYVLLKKACIHLFIFFAFIIWPIWIPLACYVMETSATRKKIIACLLLLGGLFSLGIVYESILNDVHAAIVDKHIVYVVDKYPAMISKIFIFMYGMATIVPFFISSIPWAPFFGVLVGASAGITLYYWYTAFISVWCFFAALLSGLIFILIPRRPHH